MNKFAFVLVVEDKLQEQAAAIKAVRNAYDVSNEEELYSSFSTREDLGGLDTGNWGVNHYSTVWIFLAEDLLSAEMILRDIMERNNPSMSERIILTDLMFPRCPEASAEQPNGLAVLAKAVDEGIPVVVCSDTHHHDVHYMRALVSTLAKAHPLGEIPVILDEKNWDEAIAKGIELSRKIAKSI